MKIPADAIAGTKHVVGVVPLNVDTDDAKDNTDSLLLRFFDDNQVSRVAGRAVDHSQWYAALLTLDLTTWGHHAVTMLCAWYTHMLSIIGASLGVNTVCESMVFAG